MSSANGKPEGRDELLDNAVVAYLEAVEGGQAPPLQDWLSLYPELASELAGFLADQDKVERWLAPIRQAARLEVASDDVTAHQAPSLPLPTKVGPFGDYLLLEEISRGGMGIIYLARQANLDRLVAIKMIMAGRLASPADVERFHTEAIAAARLDHPNIVPIYEVGQIDGQHFYSMKIMEGGSLADRLAELSRRPRAAAALIARVAQAVHHAHQHGILHCDLKPANVLLDAAGEPHVSDFGLAKRMEDVPHSEEPAGTPSYMSPEQAIGQKGLTTAADVYGLGAILYALLTGRPPFKAETREETLKLVAEQAPVRPRLINGLIDRELEAICLKCLHKAPLQRYASAQALAEDLQRYLKGEPTQAFPTPPWKRPLKWAKRQPAMAALVVASLATVISLLTGYLQYQERRVAAAEQTLKERRRLDFRRNEVQSLVAKGQEAMARAEWSEARVHFASASQLVGTEPGAFSDLEGPVERLLGEATHSLNKGMARREAEQKYQHFMELRERALFQVTLASDLSFSANLNNIRQTVRQALACFEVAIDHAQRPVFEDSFTQDEKKEVQEGCYELLLILAENLAQERSPQIDQALRILDQASQFGYQTKAYHLLRGRYLKQLRKEADAKNESDRAAVLQPVGAFDYFLMGEDLHRHGEMSQAVRAFQTALRLQPDHLWARYLLAACYLRLQPARADLASDALTACLSQRRNIPWIYLLLGISHGELELFQAAEEDFQKALALKPSEDAHYAILVNRGVLLTRQKKFVQAVADLRRAIDLKPGQYQAYTNLAKVFQQQRAFVPAIEQMNHAIAKATNLVQTGQLQHPALAFLYRNRAMLQLDLQNSEAALQDLGQAIQIEPRPEDHAESGRILYGLQRLPEALRAYEAALKANAEHGGALLGRAETLLRLENYKEAISSLDRYLKGAHPSATPNVLANAYRARGLASVKLGHYADSINDFSLALGLKQDSATRAYRGWAFLVSKSPQLALLDFDDAIRLDPNNGDAYSGRGAARVKLGAKLSHYQEAVADAEKAIYHGGKNDPRIRWEAARIYAQAVAKLESDRNRQTVRLSGQYRERALRLLREAVHLTPANERETFMRKYIQADPDLSEFAGRVHSG
jgi:serine/threonine protein kinase/Flp pilus assembly protein TadD